MNLADSIRMKSEQPMKLAENAANTLWVESAGSKRIVLKRHRPEMMEMYGYAKCWVTEQETISRLPHPNLLRPEAQGADCSLEMEHVSLVSLYDYMAENPAFVMQEDEMERIIGELLGVLEHLHRNGLFVIDLNPHNLMLTRSGRAVKVFSIGSPYLIVRQQLWPDRSDYLAPELMDVNAEITLRADIYAAGKLIDFLHSYGQLPYKYKAVVKRCTNANPAERYPDIASIREDIKQRAKRQTLYKYAKITAGAAAVAGIVWAGSSYEGTPYVEIDPAANSDNTVSVIEARRQYGLDEDALAALMANDTIEITDEDWAVSDSLKSKLSAIFRRQFLKKATPIIHRIYNRQILDGTGNNFQTTIAQGFEDLKQIKEEIMQQSGLDALTADRIAAEVISEISAKEFGEE